MRIGIIGSGKIGGTLARSWARAGHEVAIANSRGPESLAGLVGEIGSNAHAATAAEAAEFGEMLLLAIPFGDYATLPFDHMTGKIVIDAMNYYPERDGEIDTRTFTSSEQVALRLPAARVVKAFNTLYYETLASKGRPDAPLDDRLAIFVAGDDPEAKALVTGLIQELGFAPVDTGSLREGSRKQQPGSPIYNRPLRPEQAKAMLPGA
jgi:predicted dinucleotide-binding enzyme